MVVVNHAGAILLIRRTDNGNWALPGGGIDLGESVAQTAVHETFEESGIECVIIGIVGIYSDPNHVILYAGFTVLPVNPDRWPAGAAHQDQQHKG